jgi:pyruvate/2-oxoglutarate dehydrogenase complex dihydrolipoamide dehydrogenase (E3) component
MVAAGRRPNVEGLNLEAAEVKHTAKGITVNNLLQTDNEDIYGVGDCVSMYQFTHNSDTHARYVVRNALLYGQND